MPEDQAPYSPPPVSDRRRAMLLHLSLLGEAAECERLARTGGPHAAMEAEAARNTRASADALAAIIAERFPDVTIPDARQLSLLADGGAP